MLQHEDQCIYLMSGCCLCVLLDNGCQWHVKEAVFVPVLPGWRDHKDHESLHKHDREEAVQCEVGLQLRQQLDQVMAGDETVGKRSQAPTGIAFPSSHQATRTKAVTTGQKAETFSHPAVNISVAFLQTCYAPSLNALVIPHTLVKVFSFQKNQLLHSWIFLLNPCVSIFETNIQQVLNCDNFSLKWVPRTRFSSKSPFIQVFYFSYGSCAQF